MLASLLAVGGCTPTDNGATFRYFEYQGQDARFDKTINAEREYLNPIISGFYPDPSICRKGDDYYMVHSTFSYFPGIPILHSRDLVNWEQIGNVLDRPSQLQLDGIRLDGGVYAPAISYNKANDTFYLVNTCVDGIGNFVVKTQDPRQGWSEPILLPDVGGIDPSFFFDEDGKAYIINNDAPENIPEYDGHRAIWIHDYDVATDQTFGTPQAIVDGGTDKSKKPVWIEGPHIYKIKGKYYLMAAEGGTSTNHSEVIFTAENVKGPYTPVIENPVLTQRDLPEERAEKVTCTGHADLIETPTGEWFAIFLGCRPYEDDLYNTGRETFLLPVSWENDVPIILEKGKALPTVVAPNNWKADTENIRPEAFTGNFTWKDDFKGDKLGMRWLFIRTPHSNWWKLNNDGLHITPTTDNINKIGTPAFVGYRQQHTNFTVTTQMNFTPKTEQDIAGLVCYQNERFNIVFGKTLRAGKESIVVISTVNNVQTEPQHYTLNETEKDYPIYLRIVGKAGTYDFELSFDGNNWQPVATGVDATILSTHKAGGFTGTVIGMYAGANAKS
ncbi:Non-reducing end alpha-L-arabinofuranosidase BoGH43A [termite gut metagenome]|uniref:Non-reducing end alpha-L-arabinofuranosidase BoGH43A n=1 Tax=termite gut metagenome TaxID=433724 RepID=A0A5J4SQ97_9ZZZZ